MGIDLFDVACEIEKHFGVSFEIEDVKDEWSANDYDCTVGRLHELVCKKCLQHEIEVPENSWYHIRKILAKSLQCREDDIHPDAWLRRDLGCD